MFIFYACAGGCVCVLAAGRFAITASYDETLGVWDLANVRTCTVGAHALPGCPPCRAYGAGV